MTTELVCQQTKTDTRRSPMAAEEEAALTITDTSCPRDFLKKPWRTLNSTQGYEDSYAGVLDRQT